MWEKYSVLENLKYKGKIDMKSHGMRNSSSFGYAISPVFKYILMLFVTFISLMPILWALSSSFKTSTEIFGGFALALPSQINFRNYVDAFRISPIGQYYFNSLYICILSMLLNTFLVAACAYVVARFNFRLKNVIIILISAALLLPLQSISQPIFVFLNFMKLSDTKTGLILVYTALGMPVAFYVMRSYFLSIPVEIEESAYIDGASFSRTFTRIILPVAKPGLATSAILQFLFSWKEFYFALILTSGNRSRTLPLALNYFTSQFSSNYPAMFAAIILTIVPSIIIYLIIQDQVEESLTAGAVKA